MAKSAYIVATIVTTNGLNGAMQTNTRNTARCAAIPFPPSIDPQGRRHTAAAGTIPAARPGGYEGAEMRKLLMNKKKRRLQEIDRELFQMMDNYFWTGYLDIGKHERLTEEKFELKRGTTIAISPEAEEIKKKSLECLQKYFTPPSRP